MHAVPRARRGTAKPNAATQSLTLSGSGSQGADFPRPTPLAAEVLEVHRESECRRSVNAAAPHR